MQKDLNYYYGVKQLEDTVHNVYVQCRIYKEEK